MHLAATKNELLFALAGGFIFTAAVTGYHLQLFPFWLWAIPKTFYPVALILFVKYS